MTGSNPADDLASASGRVVSRRSVLLLGAAAALTACSTPGPVAAPASASAAPAPAGTNASPTSASTGPAASVSATAGTSPARGTREVTHGPRSVAAVALTFHGAGDPRFADAIMTAAERVGAVLTVLAVGSWLQTYPQMGDRVLAGGHELGNHTLHHRPMRLMGESAAYTEIVGGQREVQRFTTAPSWFRPSGTPHARASRTEIGMPSLLEGRIMAAAFESTSMTPSGASQPLNVTRSGIRSSRLRASIL